MMAQAEHNVVRLNERRNPRFRIHLGLKPMMKVHELRLLTQTMRVWSEIERRRREAHESRGG